MSQVTSPTTTLRSQVRAHRIVGVSALVALLATAAIVLVLALDGGTSDESSAAQSAQPALRTDGGLEESAVAASERDQLAITRRWEEYDRAQRRVAASVGTAQPDASQAYVSESRIAAAIAGR